MAKLGFYDIRTFETLSREMQNSCFQYKSIHETEDAPEDLKKEIPKKGSETNRRKAKQFSKSLRPATV